MSTLEILGYALQYGSYGIAVITIITLGLKVWKKAVVGDVDAAKEEARKVADRLVDILIDVIEKYDLGEAKKAVAEEVEKDTNVKIVLNKKLDEKNYRKKERGN